MVTKFRTFRTLVGKNLSVSVRLLVVILAAVSLSGCAKVGSERWCDNMEGKAKGDWTANEATDYAKHCVFK